MSTVFCMNEQSSAGDTTYEYTYSICHAGSSSLYSTCRYQSAVVCCCSGGSRTLQFCEHYRRRRADHAGACPADPDAGNMGLSHLTRPLHSRLFSPCGGKITHVPQYAALRCVARRSSSEHARPSSDSTRPTKCPTVEFFS